MEEHKMPIRVLIADDHPAVREGIQMFLATEPCIQIVGKVENCQEAVSQSIKLKPDVILMDLLMPDDCGLEAIAEIKNQLPSVKIIVLTIVKDERVVRMALGAGADGYLVKGAESESLLQAIYAVQRGNIPLDQHFHNLGRDAIRYRHPGDQKLLTAREKQVLCLMARGLSNRAIGRVLDLSENTVSTHVRHIFDKLCVSSRTEAVILAMELSLISPEEVRCGD